MFKNEVEKLTKMFSKNGFTVTKYGNDSILVENNVLCGAFTLYGEKEFAGAFYTVSVKKGLLQSFELAQRLDRHPLPIGWHFYWESTIEDMAKQRFTLKEMESLIKGGIMKAA